MRENRLSGLTWRVLETESQENRASARPYLCQEPPVKYAFIQRHDKKYRIEMMCRVLRASRSGYNEWRRGGVTQRQVRQRQLLAEIKRIHEESRGSYGSPRILRELRKDGIVVNHKAVEEMMKKHGIHAKRKKKFETREQARLSIFDYIEMFYNKRRLHSHLNYVSPEEFEKSMETA